ncbi:MAG: outer membrane beta-barrel protein [Endozoicomonas sp.]|uniref:outer membrane beta-barrel protein n=1 Tax=Endozoicomonas sp. TaxID=1892382 RepID=UPI003D9B1A28
MNKVFTAAAVMTVAVMSSSAMAGDWFVGVEAGKSKDAIEGKYVDESISDFSSESSVISEKLSSKAKTGSYGIRVGKYLDDNVRVYGTASKSSFKDSAVKQFNKEVPGKYEIDSQQSLMMSMDYVFMKDSMVRPFVGGSLGVNRIEAFGKKDTSVAYGAQAGVLFIAGPVDFELGMKYIRKNNRIKMSHGVENASFELKDSKQAYLSAAYRF